MKPYLALLAAVGCALSAAPASAQYANSVIQICENKVQLTAYAQAHPAGNTGGQAYVVYLGNFHNNTRQPITVTVLQVAWVPPPRNGSWVYFPRPNAPPVIREQERFTLSDSGNKDGFTLYSVNTQNPAATGGPSPAQVAAGLRFSCAAS